MRSEPIPLLVTCFLWTQAIIVIDATQDDFKANQSVTMEHLLIAYSLGVRDAVVAVNKMDAIRYDETRFDEIKNHMESGMKKIGLRNVWSLPISGLKGENFVSLPGHHLYPLTYARPVSR